MAKDENGNLTSEDYEQLISHIFDRAHAALSSNQRSEYHSTLEEIADLCDPDTDLIFNADGTVEIDESEEEEDEAA